MIRSRFLTASVVMLSVPAAIGLAFAGGSSIEEALAASSSTPLGPASAILLPTSLQLESSGRIDAHRSGVSI